ncbi:5-methylcytosine restriction system specificity protein McrC [Sorangium sp. KYC3313]|uniref:5-methylcytosine restriction system specificity protein McrC n=1 Tax=Sorangium sp. KYC3313 TaxID=3449740 RepID=UPI003F8C6520
MKEVREGVAVDLDLAPGDVAYLRPLLGLASSFERQGSGAFRTLIRRVAGLWALPSGETLVVQPEKGNGADVFAWMCAVDPRFRPVKWRGTAPEGADGQHGVASIAVRAFAQILEEDLSRAGPRRDYQRREADASVLRGTIRWAELARRTSPVPVPCRYWERTIDTPLNRLFAAAVHAASAHDSLREAGGMPLDRLHGIFGHIPRLPPAWILDSTRPLPRLEADFEAARSLAITILEAFGISHGGAQRALAFHVDLERLFEMTIEAAARTQAWDGKVAIQCQPPYEADVAGEESRIDVLVRARGEALVIDAKYSKAFSKSHLYQVLAYMKMLGARRGALVYPKGAELRGERFWSAPGGPEWEVRLHEVDLVAVASNGRRELERLGEALKAGMGRTPEEATA